MSADPKGLVNPKKLDYKSEVINVLQESENHMSVSDIRLELTYRENGIELGPDYDRENMESDIEEALEEEILPAHDDGELELSKMPFIEDEPIPAEVEYTEQRYKII